MQRHQILNKITKKEALIKKLENEVIQLEIENLKFSDRNKKYSEEIEDWGNGKLKRKELIGRVKWTEYFLDESTGKKIPIKRNRVVRIGNYWDI